MSFSDFGGPSSRAKVANNNANNGGSKNAATTSGGGGGPPGLPTGNGALAVISETLLQYQRNVGILEGIVQNLPAGGGAAAETAVLEQYEAQKHVLEQLQDKIKSLLQRQQPPQNNNNSAVIKLLRDFQTIQARATRCHETATRKLAQKAMTTTTSYQQQQLLNNNNNNNADSSSSTNSYQQQQRLQAMEDRLHEQIMREREDEIRTINQGMHTVNEIYKDLAHIVSTQQENIDQIETQMEVSKVNAENGLKQVELANEKFGSTNCILM